MLCVISLYDTEHFYEMLCQANFHIDVDARIRSRSMPK